MASRQSDVNNTFFKKTSKQKCKPQSRKINQSRRKKKKRSTARDSIVTFHTKDQREIIKREKENRSTKKGQKIRLISAFLLSTLDARR